MRLFPHESVESRGEEPEEIYTTGTLLGLSASLWHVRYAKSGMQGTKG